MWAQVASSQTFAFAMASIWANGYLKLIAPAWAPANTVKRQGVGFKLGVAKNMVGAKGAGRLGGPVNGGARGAARRR